MSNRTRGGGYSYLEALVARNFALGARLDRAGDPLVSEQYRWGLLPYITWWQSEYVRFRGEYGYYILEPSGENENRFTLQSDLGCRAPQACDLLGEKES